MINWKVRIKNKVFWISIIPLIFLLAQQVLAIFGISVDFANLQDQVIAVIGTVFAILALIGIVADPTTEGVSDSAQAKAYDAPKSDEAYFDEVYDTDRTDEEN